MSQVHQKYVLCLLSVESCLAWKGKLAATSSSEQKFHRFFFALAPQLKRSATIRVVIERVFCPPTTRATLYRGRFGILASSLVRLHRQSPVRFDVTAEPFLPPPLELARWSKTPNFGHHLLGRVFSQLCESLAPPRQWIHVVPGQMGK